MISVTKSVNFLVIISILFCLLLGGCGGRVQVWSEDAFLLDTMVSISYYDPADREAVLGALDLCRDYALVFSRTDPDSELCRLNANRALEVSDDLLTVLEAALSECAASGGRLDISMGGVSALYDFTGDPPRRPEAAALAAALEHVDYRKIHINGHTVTLEDPAAVIDLGAAAKGYIADRMRDYLLAQGVEHAILDLGGNILTLGGRPDGQPFRIAIRMPERDSSQLAATLAVTEESVVTSGVYQRSFEAEGRLWHHLLDPASGEPIDNGLRSVSVVGPCSLDCDLLSTACFALGLEAGLEHIEALAGYEALFITEDGALHMSSGFRDLLVRD